MICWAYHCYKLPLLLSLLQLQPVKLIQVGEPCLPNLPAELISKIASWLPILDRMQFEATCKTFLKISRQEATAIDFTMTSVRELNGASDWFQRIDASALQDLRLVTPESSHEMLDPDIPGMKISSYSEWDSLKKLNLTASKCRRSSTTLSWMCLLA